MAIMVVQAQLEIQAHPDMEILVLDMAGPEERVMEELVEPEEQRAAEELVELVEPEDVVAELVQEI
jgi:hypothetical protein